MQVGDVVRLKSGGPKMTVTGLPAITGKDEQANCTWFTADEAQDAHTFPIAALELLDAGLPAARTLREQTLAVLKRGPIRARALARVLYPEEPESRAAYARAMQVLIQLRDRGGLVELAKRGLWRLAKSE